ncbi:hypothetical protein C5E08_03490 [Rathayibacter iranicus]|uniref:Fido domain-containing protein n=1 Tax=Rathayibacter iranicus TaxID=59737 RepID=A0AAD2PTV5_9MICO|nr:hypothetical protein C7V51_03480 [Rathayibacter iranicus]PPI61962.1 hypothetical protein C5E08_03490 [Rathayibacter iranicus]
MLSTTISDGTHWDNLLAQFPSYPGDVLAVPEPAWDDLSDLVARIAPKGRDRAVARYLACESRALFNDARLEGFAYTEPEIATLINGGHVAGHTLGEEAQVAGMKAASDLMLRRVEDGPLEPTKALSDDLHLQVALSLGLKSLAFRGDQRKQYAGPLVTLDYGERFRALDARVTPAVLDSGLRRIKQLDHPVLRAVTWAAFATYSQFYLEGNRRAGRYVMNAVVMSHGFDAILIPDRLKAEYQDALVESYRSGNVTSHIRFLLELYNDQ